MAAADRRLDWPPPTCAGMAAADRGLPLANVTCRWRRSTAARRACLTPAAGIAAGWHVPTVPLPAMPRSLLPPCPPGAITHPLEMFPPLRRWPRSVPRDILYTFLWNTLVALFFAGLTVVFDARAPFGGVLRAIFVIAQ